MNNQEFNEVFKLLLTAYPNTKDKESVATIYFLTIANELTKKEFAEAVVKILKTRKSGFIPQPAEILEVAKKTANIEHQVILAKKMLIEGVRKVGSSGMVAFEDKGLHAVIDFLGWRRICTMDKVEFDNFLNFQFDGIYKDFLENPYETKNYYSGTYKIIGQAKLKLITYASVGIKNTKNLNFIKLEYKPQNEVRSVDFSELREKMLIGG